MSTSVDRVPPRSEVPIEETWDLESVFPNDAAWEAAFQSVEEQLPVLAGFAGRIAEGPRVLLEALRARDHLETILGPVVEYALLRRAEDATNQISGEMADRAISLSARAGATGAFIPSEVASLSDETLATWFAQEPELEAYCYAIERITRRRAHIRSAEVEMVLASSSEVAAAADVIHSVLEDGELPLGEIADEHGNPVRLAHGNLQQYLESNIRRVRQDAWQTSADAYLAFRNTFAATLSGAIKRDVFYARARNFGSSLEAALADENIPTAVFHNLLDTVWRHFPVWHRYFAVRRRLLGLAPGDQHVYDLEAPLSIQPRITWEEGVELVLSSLEPLGADYVAEVRRGLASRWTDRCANIGKGGGAFSAGVYGTEPFIYMTWQDNLTSISTLIHEIGHSMHSLLTWRHQPVTYAHYGLCAAETASNFCQALMGDYLLKLRDDRDWTIAVIEERMANYMRYLFTMPILARFELAAHERVESGAALSADWMSQAILSSYREGYGGEVSIDEPRAGITWARFPHLFMNFYVFQYGIGISAAAALSQSILAGDEAARDRYLDFLKAGGSRDQIAALRDAGVDMSTPEPIERAFAVMSGYIDRLEELAS